uniref:Uncharacterized protein n=1 Tax=Romanomermis culicivorax TaxID=13658 RepID=A0A915J4V8_ROMCU
MAAPRDATKITKTYSYFKGDTERYRAASLFSMDRTTDAARCCVVPRALCTIVPEFFAVSIEPVALLRFFDLNVFDRSEFNGCGHFTKKH